MVSELWKLPAHEVVSLLRTGALEPLEVLEAAIERIEEVDSTINALPIRLFEQARERARRLDLTAERQNPKSLMGLPIAVKDYNDLGGVRTTYGSPIFEDHVAATSDATIAQLERNGANAVAKSNVPEWAGGHTFNPVFGVTRNPFDLHKTVGGSSGGSAAALASGQVWLATGNDLGGSLRTPAAFNGVVGLRPSPGVVPRGTRLQPFDTLWVEGPMARSVRDVALMLDAGAGYSSQDPLSFHPPAGSYVTALKAFDAPKRVAFSKDLGIVPMAREIVQITQNAAEKISGFGIEVIEEIPDFSGVLEGFQTLRGVLLATMLDDLIAAHRDAILPDILKNAEVGHQVSNRQIIQAEKIRRSIVHQMHEFFQTCDFLICPTTSVAPFDVEHPFVTEIDGQPCETYIDWFAITFALSMTGCPVVSLPCGFTDAGLPVGVQIVGQPRQEAALLAFAEFLEQNFDMAVMVPR